MPIFDTMKWTPEVIDKGIAEIQQDAQPQQSPQVQGGDWFRNCAAELAMDPEHIPAIITILSKHFRASQSDNADTARLDWCERNLINLYDGGGAYGIEFGPIGESLKIDYCLSLRKAIDAAIAQTQNTQGGKV